VYDEYSYVTILF